MTIETKEWKKVKHLAVGMQIAVPRFGVFAEQAESYNLAGELANDQAAAGEGDILWDEIVSIEKIGVEQVYDIEVEGTHNSWPAICLTPRPGFSLARRKKKYI